ncbi:TIGR04423 family type III CRISPR-associated protein [Halosquirtibacter laminarini]|uniref:TIGR04423 family type III CRISPR-associated protein n=1 Tax=Halosquirtibacter laminarini TaxID=3374600 RepID=A0AC61NIH2_9BACT|nr:TIGR04423 family type III CRISPR-associated protein [Prolixibacteraceae bacterium]
MNCNQIVEMEKTLFTVFKDINAPELQSLLEHVQEGYYWSSDKTEPVVLKQGVAFNAPCVDNPYIVEAYLLCQDSDQKLQSVTVKDRGDGATIVVTPLEALKENMSMSEDLKKAFFGYEKSYESHRMDNRYLSFYEVWKLEEEPVAELYCDESNETMMVFKPFMRVFNGFVKK